MITFFVVGLIVFVLLWIGITKAPLPADLPWLRNLLYVVLVLVTAVILWQRFLR